MTQTPQEIAAQIIARFGPAIWPGAREEVVEAIASALSEATSREARLSAQAIEVSMALSDAGFGPGTIPETVRAVLAALSEAHGSLIAAQLDRAELTRQVAAWQRDYEWMKQQMEAARDNRDAWIILATQAQEAKNTAEAALSEARHQRDEAIQARDFMDSEMVQLWRDLTALAATWRAKGDSEHHAWRSGADEKYRWRSSTLAQCASELESAAPVPAAPSESGKADPSRILFAKKELEAQQPPQTPRDETP